MVSAGHTGSKAPNATLVATKMSNSPVPFPKVWTSSQQDMMCQALNKLQGQQRHGRHTHIPSQGFLAKDDD